uniref:Uncharacterized protein n=1 Tax=Arundo donax TaxID=35708 RepID=A0A0A9HCE6_ARUDO
MAGWQGKRKTHTPWGPKHLAVSCSCYCCSLAGELHEPTAHKKRMLLLLILTQLSS